MHHISSRRTRSSTKLVTIDPDASQNLLIPKISLWAYCGPAAPEYAVNPSLIAPVKGMRAVPAGNKRRSEIVLQGSQQLIPYRPRTVRGRTGKASRHPAQRGHRAPNDQGNRGGGRRLRVSANLPIGMPRLASTRRRRTRHRSIIGEVVGMQPLGRDRLSSTGPKAGGPDTLLRRAVDRTVSVDINTQTGDPALRSATDYSKTIVWLPLANTRRSACQRTARARTAHSTSCPIITRSSAVRAWVTRRVSCSMIGPSSRSVVT